MKSKTRELNARVFSFQIDCICSISGVRNYVRRHNHDRRRYDLLHDDDRDGCTEHLD